MLAYSIDSALSAETVSEVYVSTDDQKIVALTEKMGATAVHRPIELAGDEATSESALLHVLNWRNEQGLSDPNLVVFLQCTSPVRRGDDIDGAVRQLIDHEVDSIFSAAENQLLVWSHRPGSQPASVNYDYKSRKREQDMDVQMRENGSIYVFKPEILRTLNNRLGGKMDIYEMDYWSSFQVDTPEHIELAEWILGRAEYAPATSFADRIDLVVFDFDGVMTENGVWLDQDGREAVRCDRSDGLGLTAMRKAGVAMMVMSTEKNLVVGKRCEKLQLPCAQGIDDKGAFLAQTLKERGIDPAHVAYVGNDTNDLTCLRQVGLPVVVADAHPDVMSSARFVLTRRGGQGAVREFCDLLLQHRA